MSGCCRLDDDVSGGSKYGRGDVGNDTTTGSTCRDDPCGSKNGGSVLEIG